MLEPELTRIEVPTSNPKHGGQCAISAQCRGFRNGDGISHVGLLVQGEKSTDWYILEVSRSEVDVVVSRPNWGLWTCDYLLVWPELDPDTCKAVRKLARAVRAVVESKDFRPFKVFADRRARFDKLCFGEDGLLHGVDISSSDPHECVGLRCSTFIVVLINSISGCDCERPRCLKTDYLVIADDWINARRTVTATDAVTAACLCTAEKGASLASVNEHRIIVDEWCNNLLQTDG